MINPRELYTFLELFDEMCQNYPCCEGCELVPGKCFFGGLECGKVEQVEEIVLAVERWKAIREKEIAKRELKEFVERLAKEFDGVTRIEGDALVIDGSTAGKIRIELGGAN